MLVEEKLPETADAFLLLERSTTQKTKALSAAASLDALETLSATHWKDPFSASILLRRSFRKEKAVRLVSEERAGGVKDRYGLGERVRMEDLRTPRVGGGTREEEDREWEEAKRERERRDEIVKGKRRREVDQVGWKNEGERTSKSKKSSSSSTSTTKASTSTRSIKPLPSRSSSSKLKPSPSKALESLASKLGLTSALKSDPFKINGSSGSERKGGSSRGDLGIKLK